MIVWDKQTESPWSDIKGTEFYSYPNTTVLPYVRVSEEDILKAPQPLWITDIHPEDPLGKIVESQDGTYWIDLEKSFEAYLATIEPKHKKKFLKNLSLNSDLEIHHDLPNVIDEVWGNYVDRLNQLAARNGAENYTEEELAFRYKFYTAQNIRTLSIVNHRLPRSEQILAVNISLWESRTVFDLACMIRPSSESLPRTLGTFAILQNIKHAIENDCVRYDLLACNYGYKTSFGAQEYKLKAIVVAGQDFFDEYQIPADLRF